MCLARNRRNDQIPWIRKESILVSDRQTDRQLLLYINHGTVWIEGGSVVTFKCGSVVTVWIEGCSVVTVWIEGGSVVTFKCGSVVTVWFGCYSVVTIKCGSVVTVWIEGGSVVTFKCGSVVTVWFGCYSVVTIKCGSVVTVWIEGGSVVTHNFRVFQAAACRYWPTNRPACVKILENTFRKYSNLEE